MPKQFNQKYNCCFLQGKRKASEIEEAFHGNDVVHVAAKSSIFDEFNERTKWKRHIQKSNLEELKTPVKAPADVENYSYLSERFSTAEQFKGPFKNDRAKRTLPLFDPHKAADTSNYFLPELDEKSHEHTRQPFSNTYQRASVIRSQSDVFTQDKEFEQRNLLRYNAEAMILHGNILQQTGKLNSRNLFDFNLFYLNFRCIVQLSCKPASKGTPTN